MVKSDDRQIAEPGTAEWRPADQERMQGAAQEFDILLKKYPELAQHLKSGPMPEAAPQTPAIPQPDLGPDFSGVVMGAPNAPQAPAMTPGAVPPLGNLQAGARAAQNLTAQGTNAAISAGNEALAGQDTATQLGQTAAIGQYAQDRTVAAAQKPVYEQDLKSLQDVEQSFSATMADIAKRKTEGFDRYLGAVDDLKNTHIYSWWSEASTGAKVLGLLSQAMAGALQGLSGQSGPTPLDRIIEQDITRQRMNLAQKSDTAQQSAGLYKDLMGELKDRVVVEGAMRDIAYNSTIHRLQDMAATAGNADKTKLQQTLAALQQKSADNRTQILQYIGQTAQQGGVAASGFLEKFSNLWVTARGQDVGLATHMAGQKAGTGLANVKNFELFQKNNPEQARQIEERVGGAQGLKTTLSDLQSAISLEAKDPKTGKPVRVFRESSLSPDQRADLDQLIAQAILQVQRVAKLGAISEGDKQLASAVVGDNANWASTFMRSLGLKTYGAMFKRLEKARTNTDKLLKSEIDNITVPGPNGQMIRLQYQPEAP